MAVSNLTFQTSYQFCFKYFIAKMDTRSFLPAPHLILWCDLNLTIYLPFKSQVSPWNGVIETTVFYLGEMCGSLRMFLEGGMNISLCGTHAFAPAVFFFFFSESLFPLWGFCLNSERSLCSSGGGGSEVGEGICRYR